MATVKDIRPLSQQIWERIKDIDLELFALAGQTVEKNSDPVIDMSPIDLHLILKAQAALPQLEDKLRGFKWSAGFTLAVEVKPKFTVVKVVPVD